MRLDAPQEGHTQAFRTTKEGARPLARLCLDARLMTKLECPIHRPAILVVDKGAALEERVFIGRRHVDHATQRCLGSPAEKTALPVAVPRAVTGCQAANSMDGDGILPVTTTLVVPCAIWLST